jgi:hypothetical protein
MRKLLTLIEDLYWDNLPKKTLPYSVNFACGAVYKHDVFFASFLALDCDDLREMLKEQRSAAK